MKSLFLKIFLILIPFILLLALFFVLDPFKIIHDYENYSSNLYVIPNRDYVSSEVYMKNKNKYHYDSFIFGSSRTMAFKTATWRHYLSSSASPFVFDAAGENIFGIYKKITYLDKDGADLQNALVLIDEDETFTTNTDLKGHLFIKHPDVAGTSWFNFYVTFIKDYFDINFLAHYYYHLFTHQFNAPIEGYVEYSKIKYDPVTNDVYVIAQENELKINPKGYYKKRANFFYDRDSIVAPSEPQITVSETAMLNEIKSVFKKHHTHYKIIIGPTYNQVEINEDDLATLQTIFGKENIFNFAGKNSFTETKENYYESSHYRSVVGDSILQVAYK